MDSLRKIIVALAVICSCSCASAQFTTRRLARQRGISTLSSLPGVGSYIISGQQATSGLSYLNSGLQGVQLLQQSSAPVQYVQQVQQPALQILRQPAVQVVQQRPVQIPVRTVARGDLSLVDNQAGVDFYAPPKYNYRYEVRSPKDLNYHTAQEERDGDVTRGSYSVLLPTGELQTVTYYADATGYHPTITIQPNAVESLFGSLSGPLPLLGN